MPMLRGDGGDQFALQAVQRGEQCQGVMAKIFVGGGVEIAAPRRLPRLGALQRPAPRLRIAAQQQRLFRRVEIQADDFPAFIIEVCIV